MSTVMNTYGRQAVEFSRGEGSWLYDTNDKAYLDALSGIAVCSLGHSHPAVTQAICEQAGKLIHTSNIFPIGQQNLLADTLCRLSGMDKVFFANSGAEANEAAIKLARLHGHQKGIGKPDIIVMEGAFHGRTMATLSATGNRKIQAGFEPLLSGFVRAPYNNVEAIATIGANNPNVVAILVEPVQGEGGVVIPSPGYLSQLRELCDKMGWLLMLDEIQTGIGRTGEIFSYLHEAILPDVVTSAKALGNGVPIGACLAQGDAAEVFQPGNHGSTFGGNPLACSAALAVLKTIEDENLCDRAMALGQRIVENLQQTIGDKEYVREIRGYGLMIAIELDRDCGSLVAAALDDGLIINVTAGNVIRLLPPLTISNDDADLLVQKLNPLLDTFAQQ
ncbi:MAG: aspartate aminotransferase family protein [Pseudomonadales bacterium]